MKLQATRICSNEYSYQIEHQENLNVPKVT